MFKRSRALVDSEFSQRLAPGGDKGDHRQQMRAAQIRENKSVVDSSTGIEVRAARDKDGVLARSSRRIRAV